MILTGPLGFLVDNCLWPIAVLLNVCHDVPTMIGVGC